MWLGTLRVNVVRKTVRRPLVGCLSLTEKGNKNQYIYVYGLRVGQTILARKPANETLALETLTQLLVQAH